MAKWQPPQGCVSMEDYNSVRSDKGFDFSQLSEKETPTVDRTLWLEEQAILNRRPTTRNRHSYQLRPKEKIYVQPDKEISAHRDMTHEEIVKWVDSRELQSLKGVNVESFIRKIDSVFLPKTTLIQEFYRLGRRKIIDPNSGQPNWRERLIHHTVFQIKAEDSILIKFLSGKMLSLSWAGDAITNWQYAFEFGRAFYIRDDNYYGTQSPLEKLFIRY